MLLYRKGFYYWLVSHWILDYENLFYLFLFFLSIRCGKSTACLAFFLFWAKTISPLLFFPLGSAGLLFFFSFPIFLYSFLQTSTVMMGGGAIGNKNFLSPFNLFCHATVFAFIFVSCAFLSFFCFSPRRGILDRKKVVPWAENWRAIRQSSHNKDVNWQKGQTKYRAREGNWAGFRVLRIPIVVIGLSSPNLPMGFFYSTDSFPLPTVLTRCSDSTR